MLKNKIKAFSVLAFVLAISLSLFGLSLDKPCAFVFAKGETPSLEESTTEKITEAKAVAKIGETEYKTLAEAIAAAQAGETVTLVADTAENVVVNKDLTIDLGDYTLFSGDKDVVFTVEKGNVIINAGKGGIRGGSGSDNIAIKVTEGNLTINGGNYYVGGDKNGLGNSTVYIADSGTVTINGGMFETEKSWKDFYYVLNINNSKTGTFIVKGGTFIKYNPAVGDDNMHGNFVAAGFYSIKEGNVYTVSKTKPVAQIGTDNYASLKTAFEGAKKGDTVTMIADYNVEKIEDTVESQNIVSVDMTLDLNGHKITFFAEMSEYKKNHVAICVKNGATFTVTDSSAGGNGGIISALDKSSEPGNNIGPYTFDVVNGALVIDGGYYLGGGTVAQVETGKVTVNGGVFEINPYGKPYYYDFMFNCIDSAYIDGTATIEFNGGTFKNWDPFNSAGDKKEGVNARFTMKGVGVTKNSDGDYVATSGKVAQVVDVNGDSVAAYATLAEAIVAAKKGETIILVDNVELSEQIAISEGITIDGQNKYAVVATKNIAGSNKAGMFYRTTSAHDTLTFKNVTLDGNGVSKIFLNEGGAGETVFDGVTSQNGGGITHGSGIHISGGGSHATIKNSTLIGSKGNLELNEENYYAANDLWVGGNVYVTVENSTIGYVFVNSAPTATATNGVVHGQLTITGENTKITYLSGEEEAADKLDKYGNNGSLVKIENGSIDKIFDKGSFAISGGTFKTELKQEWLVKGFKAVANNDGTYGVVKCSTLKEYLVNLGTSLTLKIGVNEVGKNVKVTYAYNGGKEVVAEKVNGYYIIAGITPQIIDRVYTVKVYEGETVVDSKELSVLGYCDTLLGTTTATEKAKAAVKALVYYGKAAKKFLGIGDTTAIDEVIKKYSLTETELAKPTSGATSTGKNLISKVTLNVSDVNAIVYAMTEENYATVYGENSGYTVTIGGENISADKWTKDGDLYVYMGTGIYASELGKRVKVVIKKTIDDNTETVQTLVYGVYDYCANKWEADGVSGIAKAIYAYGVACAEYIVK